jgi:hypothetical protein
MPGLWRHKWRHIQFCLIADNFGVEYAIIKHFSHLLDLLKKYHRVQFNMAGDKFAVINIIGIILTSADASVCLVMSTTCSSNSSIRGQTNAVSSLQVPVYLLWRHDPDHS